MNIDENNIRTIVSGEVVGDFSPYLEGSIDTCDEYARKVIKKLEKSPILEVEKELDDYGSGYASYFDVFITKKDKSHYIQRENYTEINGITLFISRLAPIAVFGTGQKTKHETGGSYGYLSAEIVGQLPDGDWVRELEEIRNILSIYKFAILTRQEIIKNLLFDVDIPTIFDSEKVFDALFYWED